MFLDDTKLTLYIPTSGIPSVLNLRSSIRATVCLLCVFNLPLSPSNNLFAYLSMIYWCFTDRAGSGLYKVFPFHCGLRRRFTSGTIIAKNIFLTQLSYSGILLCWSNKAIGVKLSTVSPPDITNINFTAAFPKCIYQRHFRNTYDSRLPKLSFTMDTQKWASQLYFQNEKHHGSSNSIHISNSKMPTLPNRVWQLPFRNARHRSIPTISFTMVFQQ